MLDASTTVAVLSIAATIGLALVAGILKLLERSALARERERTWLLELAQTYDRAEEGSATRQFAMQELEVSGVLNFTIEPVSEGEVERVKLHLENLDYEAAIARAKRMDSLVRKLSLAFSGASLTAAIAAIVQFLFKSI